MTASFSLGLLGLVVALSILSIGAEPEETTMVAMETTESFAKNTNQGQNSTSPSPPSLASKTIEDLTLIFYKQKTGKVLQFLNQIIPTMKELQSNMTELLQTSLPLTNFKQIEDNLEKNVENIEHQVQTDHFVRAQFIQLINRTESHLKTFHENFNDLLSGQVSESVGQCGGQININVTDEKYLLKYTRGTGTNGAEIQICYWIVSPLASMVSMGLRATLLKYNGGSGTETRLLLYKNITEFAMELQPQHMGQVMDSPTDHMVIVFVTQSGRGNPGFKLTLISTSISVSYNQNGNGGAISNSINFKFIPMTVGEGTEILKYPADNSNYSDNERTFFLLTPPIGQKLETSVQPTLVTMESNYDFLRVFQYSVLSHRVELLAQYTGSSSTSTVSFYGKNEDLRGPKLLLFSSDASNNQNGFTVTLTTRRA